MSGALDRREAVARLLARRGEAVVVTGLGSPTYDVAAAGDAERNFYLWGAMGGAAMLGLGLALARPETPVIVVTGDGEMLMGLGAFATIGLQAPPNLSIVILDNERYEETGAQPSHTTHMDLAAVARACGIEAGRVLTDPAELDAAVAQIARATGGPRVLVVKIAGGAHPRVLPPREGGYLKTRLRRALGLPVE
jgi:thiamine pyrophosphate-dependent acetolactate synthase large subunit-like protein